MENQNINPWVNIWIHPRKTLRAILNSDPKKIIIWIALISGLLSSFSFITSLWMEYPQKSLFQSSAFILGVLILGTLLNLASLYFFGWLYKLTGSWIKGKGNFTDLKCAVGWSYYPFMAYSLLNILKYFTVAHLWLQVIFGLIALASSIWAFIIYFNLVGEAHQFSNWKGLLTFLIAVALLAVAFLILALLIPLLSPLFQ